MRIDVTSKGRTVRFTKAEVRELRTCSQLLSFVSESMPGALPVDVAAGVATFVARIGDDGTYAEAGNA